jgi:diguanylate cyclase (GGDEF)-like protein
MKRETKVGRSPRILSIAELRSGQVLATISTLAATILFVGVGNAVLPLLLEPAGLGNHQWLTTVLLLNIALILFGWRRSKDLNSAMTARIEAEQRAYESAYTDHVTGLSNRRDLTRVIEELATRSKPAASLLILDLDYFKKVNDQYGHAAGDRLLRFVGDTLKSIVKDGCCARLGGDEFAVLLPGARQANEVDQIARDILLALNRPVILDQTTANISASIGISSSESGPADPDVLLGHSDIAMYEAKRLGRNCFIRFESEMEQRLHQRIQLEAEIRTGIARGEFVPFYQPLINLVTNELKGFEVLARWKHPERGLLAPVEFIAASEVSHMISDLSFSVMRQALRDAKDWPANLTIAVNISPVQFKDPLLGQRIIQLLAESGFPPQRLEIEVTESALLDDQKLALSTVESLKNSGIRISLDDFGTGYASLTQLKSLPFDRIKIDRSFVSGVLDDEQSNAIVDAITTLGQTLRLPITAEGVETEEVHRQLRAIGCSDAQGWLFGEAVSGARIGEMLASGQSFKNGLADGDEPIAKVGSEGTLPAKQRKTGRPAA